MRKVLLDAHTHTVASGHAYSSLQEMAKASNTSRHGHNNAGHFGRR